MEGGDEVAKLEVNKGDDGLYTVVVRPNLQGEGRTQIESGVSRANLSTTTERLIRAVTGEQPA
jgi:hypothetical protein